MRVGLPVGVDSTTKLYLPFRNGSLTDESGNGGTVTTAGGYSVNLVPGYFSDALQFRSTGETTGRYRRVEVANASAINQSGVITLEAWVRYEDVPGPTDSAPTRSCITRRGATGQNHAWALTFRGPQFPRWTVYNSAGASDFVEAGQITNRLIARGPLTGNIYYAVRWQHVWCVFFPDDGSGTVGYLAVGCDGGMWGHKYTTLQNIQTTSLGPIQIGAETSTVVQSEWTGRIEGVRLRASAVTVPEYHSPMLGPRRVTRREFVAVNIDLTDKAQGRTWTDDGAGGFYIALASLGMGSLIVDPSDVRAVAGKSGSTTTTFAEVGNVTDLDAASNSYFIDQVNRRFYSSENPASYDTFAIQVRARLANHRLKCGFRSYIPALLGDGVDLGARSCNRFEDDVPMDGGATIQIAARHADLPAGIGSEEASSIAWLYAPITARVLSDGMSWDQAIITTSGFIAGLPADDGDTLSAVFLPNLAKAFHLPMERAQADSTAFPYLAPNAHGYGFPRIIGKNHKRVRTVVLDTRPSASTYRRGVARHRIGAFNAAWLGASSIGMYNIDLANAEVYTGFDADNEVTVDVDGFNDGSSTLVAPLDILWRFCLDYFGATAAQKGTSFTTTATRVKLWWRMVEDVTDPSGLARVLHRFLADTQLHIYHKPNTDMFEAEDVNKADASDWTLRDVDLVAEDWGAPSRELLTSKINLTTCGYNLANLANVTKGQSVTLPTASALASERVYGMKETWEPNMMCGFYTIAGALTWLAAVRAFFEAPWHMYEVTVGARFLTAECMDVVTVATSRKPTGAGARFRVHRVHPNSDGTVKLSLFSETPHPTDGTSAETEREDMAPAPRLRFGRTAGSSLTTTGAWTRVENWQEIFETIGGIAGYTTGTTHRLVAYAQRTGGAADADFQLRLQNVTDGTTIATIAGVPTAAGFVSTTTFANIPTASAQKMLEVQYLCAAGVIGTIHSISWTADETTAAPLADALYPPRIQYADAYPAGISCPATTSTVPRAVLGQLRSFYLIPGPNQRIAFTADADGTGADSNFHLALVYATATDPNASNAAAIIPIGNGGRAFYKNFYGGPNSMGNGAGPMRWAYVNIGGGSPGIVYAITVTYVEYPP